MHNDRMKEMLMRLAEEKSRQQMPSISQPMEQPIVQELQEQIDPMQDQQVAGTPVDDFFESLKESFKTPPPKNPPKTPEELRQEEYERIRQENRERMEGSRPIDAAVSQNNILDNSKNKLSEDDFTKQGEEIPRDAGVLDFMKYNVAHFDPTSEDNLMGIASGGIKDFKKMSPELIEQFGQTLIDKAKRYKLRSEVPQTVSYNPYPAKEGLYQTPARARSAADRYDNEYGGYAKRNIEEGVDMSILKKLMSKESPSGSNLTYDPSISDKLKKLKQLDPYNSNQASNHQQLSQEILDDLSTHLEQGKTHINTSDPHYPNRIRKINTKTGEFE